MTSTTKKFRVTDEVSVFRVGSNRYKPGDIAEVPDDFPAHLYSFLKPLEGEKEEGSPKPSISPPSKKAAPKPPEPIAAEAP